MLQLICVASSSHTHTHTNTRARTHARTYTPTLLTIYITALNSSFAFFSSLHCCTVSPSRRDLLLYIYIHIHTPTHTRESELYSGGQGHGRGTNRRRLYYYYTHTLPPHHPPHSVVRDAPLYMHAVDAPLRSTRPPPSLRVRVVNNSRCRVLENSRDFLLCPL